MSTPFFRLMAGKGPTDEQRAEVSAHLSRLKLTSWERAGGCWRNGRYSAGWLKLTSPGGGYVWFPEDTRMDDALDQAEARGHDVSELRKPKPDSYAYPPKPEVELYQKGYGYEKPAALGEWCWSVTFGRWGRTVTFSDGQTVYTWPKTN